MSARVPKNPHCTALVAEFVEDPDLPPGANSDEVARLLVSPGEDVGEAARMWLHRETLGVWLTDPVSGPRAMHVDVTWHERAWENRIQAAPSLARTPGFLLSADELSKLGTARGVETFLDFVVRVFDALKPAGGFASPFELVDYRDPNLLSRSDRWVRFFGAGKSREAESAGHAEGATLEMRPWGGILAVNWSNAFLPPARIADSLPFRLEPLPQGNRTVPSRAALVFGVDFDERGPDDRSLLDRFLAGEFGEAPKRPLAREARLAFWRLVRRGRPPRGHAPKEKPQSFQDELDVEAFGDWVIETSIASGNPLPPYEEEMLRRLTRVNKDPEIIARLAEGERLDTVNPYRGPPLGEVDAYLGADGWDGVLGVEAIALEAPTFGSVGPVGPDDLLAAESVALPILARIAPGIEPRWRVVWEGEFGDEKLR